MEEQYTNAENIEMYLFPGHEKYIHILYSSFIKFNFYGLIYIDN